MIDLSVELFDSNTSEEDCVNMVDVDNWRLKQQACKGKIAQTLKKNWHDDSSDKNAVVDHKDH